MGRSLSYYFQSITEKKQAREMGRNVRTTLDT